jgi:hypothetical protein
VFTVVPADLPRSLVPGPGQQDWRTLRPQRRLLVVVHNVTAATRLLDVLPLVTEDRRVQTYYTCPGSSAFTAGTIEFLAERELPTISWSEAIHWKFHAAIAASHGGPLHQLGKRLIILPHGMGYNKLLKPETGNRKPETGKRFPVFGLSADWLLYKGRLIPSVLVLSHAEQRQRLARSCPAALPAALVAGDPCFDRMLLSRPLRETYRHAFGLAEHQRLVVMSSTWGEKSLFGTNPDLPLQLAEQLPLDEFRIALALHPNIWFGHSPGQLNAWLADCRRAGIIVLPAEEGWRAALLAADLTVGDYGSVTFYSAALGTPLLLASHPTELLDPDSPIAALLAAAPHLDPKQPLLDQVHDTIAQHAPDQYADITAQTTSAPGRSHALLRSAIYRELRLSEPDTPAATSAVPLPPASAEPVEAQLIGVRREADGFVLTRFPAEVWYRAPEVARGRFLVIGTNQPRQTWLERADALVRDSPGPVRRWIDRSLAALPGCSVAAARDETGQWVIGDRSGRLLRFVRVGGGSLSADDGACCAALVCAGSALPERVTLLRNGTALVVRVLSQAAPLPVD